MTNMWRKTEKAEKMTEPCFCVFHVGVWWPNYDVSSNRQSFL